MATTRIKIPRLTLIERIQERVDSETADYEADVIKYKADLVGFHARLTAAVHEFLELLSVTLPEELETLPGINVNDYRYYPGDPFPIRLTGLRPPEQVAALRTSHLEKMLRILRASEDEYVSVATDDEYSYYL